MINLQSIFYILWPRRQKVRNPEPVKQEPAVTTYTPEDKPSLNEWARNIYRLNSKK